MSIERTLSIVKPDAVRRNLIGEILRRFESAGLRIAAGKMVRLTPERAQAFYAVHRERPFYHSLCAYMSSGPIFVSVLEGESHRSGQSAAGDDPKRLGQRRRTKRRARLGRRGDRRCRNRLLFPAG